MTSRMSPDAAMKMARRLVQHSHDAAAANTERSVLMRTTLTAPRNVVIKLRSLALDRGCSMNSLLLIAIEELLSELGEPAAAGADAGLRLRLLRSRQRKR